MTKTVEEVRRAAFDLGMREILLGEGCCLLTVPEVMASGSDGRYSSVRVRGAWEGFNAALDLLVFRLPSAFDNPDSDGSHAWNAYEREMRSAIEQTGLGLKIK